MQIKKILKIKISMIDFQNYFFKFFLCDINVKWLKSAIENNNMIVYLEQIDRHINKNLKLNLI